MKVQKRHDKLVELVRAKERVSVEALAGYLGTSRETVRRDLTRLAKTGKIQKIHGGATLPRAFGEGPFHQRMSENAAAKMRIARAAARLIKPGETVFVDTGSTTLYFAEALAGISPLTVATNSAEIARTISAPPAPVDRAQAAAGPASRIYLLGGEYNRDNTQTVGSMVVSQIRSFRAHHAVLTVGALDGRTGAMDFNIEEAQIARAMIEQSQSVTVLADSSKFNALASFEVCPLNRIDLLVCECAPPDALGNALESAGVRTIIAP